MIDMSGKLILYTAEGNTMFSAEDVEGIETLCWRESKRLGVQSESEVCILKTASTKLDFLENTLDAAVAVELSQTPSSLSMELNALLANISELKSAAGVENLKMLVIGDIFPTLLDYNLRCEAFVLNKLDALSAISMKEGITVVAIIPPLMTRVCKNRFSEADIITCPGEI